jgi:hypothetical protein
MPLPGVHTRRFHVARHMIARDIPVYRKSASFLPHFLPQPTPTSSDSDRHAPTRISRKSRSGRAFSDMNRRPDTQ